MDVRGKNYHNFYWKLTLTNLLNTKWAPHNAPQHSQMPLETWGWNKFEQFRWMNSWRRKIETVSIKSLEKKDKHVYRESHECGRESRNWIGMLLHLNPFPGFVYLSISWLFAIQWTSSNSYTWFPSASSSSVSGKDHSSYPTIITKFTEATEWPQLICPQMSFSSPLSSFLIHLNQNRKLRFAWLVIESRIGRMWWW